MKIPKIIEVPVTQAIIDAAIEADSSHCIIADAIRAALPDPRPDVDLGTTTVSLRDVGLRCVYLTSVHAQQTLIQFDQGLADEIAPFTLYLLRDDIAQVRSIARSVTDPVTGKRKQKPVSVPASADTEDLPKRGKRTRLVKIGGGKAVPSGQSRIPPVGVLSTRRGRARQYGAKLLQPNYTRAERAVLNATEGR